MISNYGKNRVLLESYPAEAGFSSTLCKSNLLISMSISSCQAQFARPHNVLLNEWLISKLQRDSLGAGGTTFLNRKTRKINDLRGFVFEKVTELLMDFITYYY